MPDTLAGWVAHLKGNSSPPNKKLWQRLKRAGFNVRRSVVSVRPANFNLPDAPNPSDQIRQQLEILWADVEFWELVAADKETGALFSYVFRNHSLLLPQMSARVWREAVQQKRLREALFALLERDHDCLEGFGVPLGRLMIRRELRRKKFAEIFEKYLTKPALDGKHMLASGDFSEGALQAIADAAHRITKDAKWCLKNPTHIPGKAYQYNKAKKPKSLKFARQVEKMAAAFAANEHATNSEVGLDENGTPDTTLQRYAAYARRLVQLREGIAAPSHTREHDGRLIGQKPRRKKPTS